MRARRRPAKTTAKKRPAPPPHPKPRRRRRPGRRFRLSAYLGRSEELAHLTRDSTRIALTLALLIAAFLFANACLKTWQQSGEKAPADASKVLTAPR